MEKIRLISKNYAKACKELDSIIDETGADIVSIRSMFNVTDTTPQLMKNQQDALTYYGIENVGLNQFNPIEKHVLCIIPASVLQDEDEFSAQYQELLSSLPSNIGGDGVEAIITKNYGNVTLAEFQLDFDIIQRVCPELVVMNDNFNRLRLSENSETFDKVIANVNQYYGGKDVFHYVSLSEIFNQFDESDRRVVPNLKTVLKVVREVELLISSYREKYKYSLKSIVCHLDSYDNIFVTQQYLTVAAYLFMVAGYKFYLPKNWETEYVNLLQKCVSRKHNYLHDYIRIMENFPFRTISTRGGFVQIFQKDIARIQRNNATGSDKDIYKMKLQMIPFHFNVTERKIQGSVLDSLVIVTDQIKIHDPRKFFNLDARDSLKGIKELETLNDLLQQMRAKMGQPELVLDCTNVLFYERQGEFFVGYVKDIKYELPFSVHLVAASCKPWFEVKPLEELEHLMNLDFVFDFSFVQMPPGVIPRFNVSQTAVKGIFLQGLRAVPVSIPLEQLTMSEVGIWSVQSSRLRDGYVYRLADLLTLDQLYDEQILGFFGGSPPSVMHEISIKSSMWRN